MIQIRIRYNTKVEAGSHLHWRVLIDGQETLASSININIPTYTTMDMVDGVEKWHIRCEANRIEWNGTKCIIN